MFLEIEDLDTNAERIIVFQYSLWVDVFGNFGFCSIDTYTFLVSVLTLSRCFWKCKQVFGLELDYFSFSTHFESMFLEICFYQSNNFGLVKFQYSLWVDVFGNHCRLNSRRNVDSSFSTHFESMFLEMANPLWMAYFPARFSTHFESMFLEICSGGGVACRCCGFSTHFESMFLEICPRW